jgi:hypothetical protein
MMFKNESDVVAKKAEKRYEVLAKRKEPSSSSQRGASPPETTSPETWDYRHYSTSSTTNTQMIPYTRYPTPESMTRELVPSIEDQALGFFLGNYVGKPTIVPRGQFEWVTELLTQPVVDDILLQSVKATSLASLANATKSPRIMQQAQAAYGSTLRITNNALHNKETATKDSTLISVIMLAMYENFVIPDRQSMDVWAKHVDGACALLNLRGDEQFQSDLGRRLFHQFYGVVLLVALQTGRAVHRGMHDLYRAMTPKSDYSVHGRAWTTRLIDAMHDGIHLNQDKHTDPKTMVTKAVNIDREMDEIKALMTGIWTYEVVHLEQPSEFLHGSIYHIYLDPWIAQMWNNVNSCRMCLYKIIRENLAKGWTQYNPPLFLQHEYESIKIAAEATQRAISAAIVASVPQVLGMIPFPDPTTAKRRASNPRTNEPLPPRQLLPPGTFSDARTNVIHLIWPLYAAAQIDLVTPGMRQWAIDTLQYIALRIGTRQAVVLAEELKEIQRTGRANPPFVYRPPDVQNVLAEIPQA